LLAGKLQAIAGLLTARCVTFAGDSPLEEAGFELPVPPERKAALDRVRRPSVSGETVANAILELASQLDLMGLALIFKLGAMPYDMVERSMTAFGEDVVPRIRPVLDRDATANFAATTPALHFA
jgi:hypothetical protein